MRLVLAPAGALLVVLGACSSSPDGHYCPAQCPDRELVFFDFSCITMGPTTIAASGPCAMGDAGSTVYPQDIIQEMYTNLGSSGPGTCHIVLTFATGFTYSADVTFKMRKYSEDQPGCHPLTCPDYLAPTQERFTVDNPSNTCLDAGR